MFGGGEQVGAQVVLTADNTGYDQAMQASAAQTSNLAATYDTLVQKVDRGFKNVQKVSFGIAAADIASMTAATVAAARHQEAMKGLAAQSNVLSREFGNGTQRMKDYSRAVNEVRGSFGSTTREAAALVQTISDFSNGGATRGLAQLANNFERMSRATGESASALAASQLTLQQTMGTGAAQTKAYSDQLTSMAEASNTNATSLANFASQIAPLGRQLNMTQSQITGFAAAFSKAGQDGYRASNVFSQMTSDIAQSLQSNSPRLAAYAQLLGVTAQNLKSMSGAKITAGLFDAIGRQGTGSLQALNALGYDGLNVTRVVSAVTQQAGGAGAFQRMANGTYGNGAASSGPETFGGSWRKFTQNMAMSGEAIGEKFLPIAQKLMTMVEKFAGVVTSFMQGPGGDLVAAFAALLAPVSMLVGGLAALHGAVLPLMGLMALKRSSFGTGIVEGFRGGGPLGASIAAGNASDRPRVASWYARGAALGGMVSPSNPRAQYILNGRGGRGPGGLFPPRGVSATDMANAERGAATSAGIFARGAGATANAFDKYLWRPQFEPLYEPDPLKREPGFLSGSRREAGGTSGGPGMVGGALSRLGAGITSATSAMSAWVMGLRKGSVEQSASSNLVAKTQTQAAAVIDAASIKLASGLNASAAAAAKNAAAQSALGGTTVGAAGRSMLDEAKRGAGGMARGVGGGLLGAAGIAGRGAMSMMGGPLGLGLMGLMFAPSLISMLKGDKDQGPSSAAQGTGLSFALPGVVAPNARENRVFDPTNPQAADYYSASQNSDFVNKIAPNIKTPEQAAAIFGPNWSKMSKTQQQSLALDLMNSKSLGGSYGKFLSLVNSGDYNTFGPQAVKQAGKVEGGLANLYAMQQQSNFLNLQDPAGKNLGALAKTFFPADDSASADMLKYPLSWKGFFTGKTDAKLNDRGEQLATALGITDKGQTKDLIGALGNRGYGKTSDERLQNFLKGLNADTLGTVLSNAGVTDITGDKTKDLAAALKAFNANAAPMLTSALKDFNLNDTQKSELLSLDASNPSYYGAKLYGQGVTQKQLSDLYLNANGTASGTIGAIRAYGNQQLQMQAPFLSSTEELFGSKTGKRWQSGVNAGNIRTDIGSFNGQFNLLAQAQGSLSTAQQLDTMGLLSGDSAAMGDLQTTVGTLTQAYTSQLQEMKQYTMTMQQMDHQAQQFRQSMKWQQEDFDKGRARARQDQARGLERAEYDFTLSRKRGEADFQLSRKRNEADYNQSRERAQKDFAHQTKMMIKQASLSMMDIYTQQPTQGFTSAQFLLTNNAQQTQNLTRQSNQLDTLRGMGLSKDAIQQLSLGDAKNNQELNGLFGQIMQNPQLIDQLNSSVQQRLAAAGSLATDASSMSYQEQVRSFNLSLDRGAADFTKSMKRSSQDFDKQLWRSTVDFNRQMALQKTDFLRQMTRQQKDFNTSVSRSWTQFGQSVEFSMKQMNEAAKPLKDTVKDLVALGKTMKGTNIGARATALATATPQITKVINGLANLLKNVDIVIDGNTNATVAEGRGGGGSFAGLPPTIQQRMEDDYPKSGMCLRDVREILGAPAGAATAWLGWLGAKGNRHRYSRTTPIGAPLWFGQEYAAGFGHVAINAGGGMMWSQDKNDRWEKKPIWPGVLGWSTTINGKQVASAGSLKGFAHGSWNLPKDQIAQIHAGEMIIPAKIAEVVRAAVTKGQVANLSTTSHPVHSVVDARSYTTTNSTAFNGDIVLQGIQNPAEFSRAMKERERLQNLAKR